MAASLESRVRKTAQRILKSMDAEKPALFRRDTWAGKAIELCLGSEPFRTAFLRFLDVFPALLSLQPSRATCRNTSADPSWRPRPRRWVSCAPIRTPRRPWTPPRCSPCAWRRCRDLRRRRQLRGSGARVRRLRGQGAAFSADILGEAVVSEREADAHVAGYLKLLDELAAVAEAWPPLGSAP